MHQMGSLSEPPLSPTTSSSQARTMPFLVNTKCAPDISGQMSSGTSGSPFTFIPGDGFLASAFDSKPNTRQQAPAATTLVNAFFPSSSRQDIFLEDRPLSSSTHAQAAAAAQQMLNRGSSFQTAGTDTNNTQSSGTSAGSSQLSNGGRHGTGVHENDEFSYNQLHTTTSAAIEDRNAINVADQPANGTGDECVGNQQASVIITEHSMIQQQDGRNKKIRPEAGSRGSESTHEHHLGSAQPVFLSDCQITKEEQDSKLNQLQKTSGRDQIFDSVVTESVRAYPDEVVTQANVSEIFPAYTTNLISSDSYNFPTAVELLGVVPSPLRHSSSHPSRGGSVPNGVQDDSGGSFGNAGTLTYPNQNLVRRLCCNTTPSVRGSWTNMASHQYVNSALRDGSLSPVREVPVSSLLSANPQDNLYGHRETPNRDGSSYFSPQQTQTDAMQLCLNPSFGVAEADSEPSVAPPGSLILMLHSGVDQLNSNHNQAPHFLDFPVSPAALSHHAQSSQLLKQGIPSARQGQHLIGNQGYNHWQNGANELPLFLPGSDSTVHTQPLTGQMSNQTQQAELGISQYRSRRSPTLTSVNQHHQYQHSIFQNGDGQSSTPGILQGLSLSLSSQQPSALQLQLPDHHGRTDEADIDVFAVMSQASVEASKGKRVEECTEGRYNGILSRFHPERDHHDLAISSAAHRLINREHSVEGKHSLVLNPGADPFVTSSSNASYGPSNTSEYLKLCQILLNEICVVRKCERRTINGDDLRPRRSNWSTHDQTSISSSSNTFASFNASREDSSCIRKDFMMNMAELPGSSSSLIRESRGREAMFQTHVQSESREDLEKKGIILGSYLEEVDRRYRAYGDHMIDTISQFNSIVGPEAATPYTALALHAMSRQFRCLRDAISGQLKGVKRALGEQDTSPGYAGRDLSSLRFVDQQALRQQRTLQQLGMLQQHAWRPQRGLPERAVSVLRAWLFEHFLHPYPKDSDKLFLAKQTGLTRSQVSNWFINARVRLWKPMVEEMYLEEFNNSEGGSGERKTSRERRRQNETMDYDDASYIVSSFSNGRAETGTTGKQQRITIACGGDEMYNPQSNMTSGHGSTQNGSTSNSLDFDSDHQRGGIAKKARNGIHNPDHVGAPIVSMDIDLVSPVLFLDPSRLDGNCGNSSGDQDSNQHEDILAEANGSRFAAYLGGNLTGYPGGGFVSRCTASTNSGVSLTLGLRHSDGLSIPGAAAPQLKYSNQTHTSSQRPKNYFDSGVQDEVARTADNVHIELPLSHLNPGEDQ